MLECVVNISEGRRPDVLDALARACGPVLLDVHTDPDHHRSVFTMASAEPAATEAATRRLARAAAEALSLTDHDGVHPRLGVIDVVPFVALAPTPTSVSVDAACDVRAVDRHRARGPGVPLRPRRSRAPDAARGSARRVLGARTRRRACGSPSAPGRDRGRRAPVLVAVNLELDDDDLELARDGRATIRERDGGLRGVRALGLRLPSQSRTRR